MGDWLLFYSSVNNRIAYRFDRRISVLFAFGINELLEVDRLTYMHVYGMTEYERFAFR